MNTAARFFRFSAPLIALVLTVFAFGCHQPVRIPIDTILYEAGDSGAPRVLIVFLPGSGDSLSVFQKKGLVEAVRAQGLPADMIAVNAHVGYYMSGTIFMRLKEDVIEPARKKRYKQIWLVGDSLGGYGALSYDRVYPGDITGIVLFGPFLGRREIIDDIKQAGGIQNWHPGDAPEKSDLKWENLLWLWIKDRVQHEQFWLWVRGSENQKSYPKIYLGYGRDDRFTYAQDFLASLMPPQHVIVIDGGHDWSTWEKLWKMFLDKNIFESP